MSILDEIEKLAQLKRAGALNEEEYTLLKENLLKKLHVESAHESAQALNDPPKPGPTTTQTPSGGQDSDKHSSATAQPPQVSSPALPTQPATPRTSSVASSSIAQAKGPDPNQPNPTPPSAAPLKSEAEKNNMKLAASAFAALFLLPSMVVVLTVGVLYAVGFGSDDEAEEQAAPPSKPAAASDQRAGTSSGSSGSSGSSSSSGSSGSSGSSDSSSASGSSGVNTPSHSPRSTSYTFSPVEVRIDGAPIPRISAPEVPGSMSPDHQIRYKARAAVVKALRLHNKKRHSEAMIQYAAALQRDPGHILARYNLACTLAIEGRRSEALSLLWDLRELGCGGCRSRLLYARTDSDFDSLHDNEDFKQITDVQRPSVDLYSEVRKVQQYFRYLNLTPLEEMSHHQRRTRIVIVGQNDYSRPSYKFFDVKGAGALRRAADYLGPRRNNDVTEEFTCDGLCCKAGKVKYPPSDSRAIRRACFWITTDDEVYLTDLEIDYHE